MPQLKEMNKSYHLLLDPSFYSLQIEGSPISTVVIIPEKKKNPKNDKHSKCPKIKKKQKNFMCLKGCSLTLCMLLGNFACFFCCLWIFLK